MGLNILTLGASKKYTEQTIVGEGAVKGKDGADGKSAYQIAKENGFAGTEQEWLESINGTNGEDGKDGYSPIITENVNNTENIYKLDIKTKDNSFTTPNLIGQGVDSGTGDENTIESISVNGTALTPSENKNVDITIPEVPIKTISQDGTALAIDENGNVDIPIADTNKIEVVKVNGVELEISDTDKSVDITVPDEYDDAALSDRVTETENAIATLNGTGEGSVSKTVDDALNKFATDLSDDGVVNTYKELVDYAANHSSDVAEMVADIEANTTAIEELNTKIADIEIPSLDGYAKTEDIPTVTNDLTDELKEKYDKAEENVQSDWEETDETSDAFIKNKPTSLPADGGDAETVNGHTVESDVPSDAKFTDTVYALPTASGDTLGGVKTTSTVTNISTYIPCPIVDGVPYYSNTNISPIKIIRTETTLGSDNYYKDDSGNIIIKIPITGKYFYRNVFDVYISTTYNAIDGNGGAGFSHLTIFPRGSAYPTMSNFYNVVDSTSTSTGGAIITSFTATTTTSNAYPENYLIITVTGYTGNWHDYLFVLTTITD